VHNYVKTLKYSLNLDIDVWIFIILTKSFLMSSIAEDLSFSCCFKNLVNRRNFTMFCFLGMKTYGVPVNGSKKLPGINGHNTNSVLENVVQSLSGENTPLRQYLREIGLVKLLTPREEIELAKRIKKGDKKAREQMITANLRLVVKIARDYEGIGVPLLDLISEGNIGLMKAVKRFDPAKGGKLSTYGSFWIKQGIKRALAFQGKTIRIPVNMAESLAKMRPAVASLEHELGFEPTPEDVALRSGLSVDRVVWLRKIPTTVSFDQLIEESDNQSTIGDMIPDSMAENPSVTLTKSTTRQLLLTAIKQLSRREAKVILERFSFNGDEKKTFEEIGKSLKVKVTKERVRQIQRTALRKLRRIIERYETCGIMTA